MGHVIKNHEIQYIKNNGCGTFAPEIQKLTRAKIEDEKVVLESEINREVENLKKRVGDFLLNEPKVVKKEMKLFTQSPGDAITIDNGAFLRWECEE